MNIREKRIAKGLLQKDILKDTGLLSKIENGKAIACPEDVERFARIFECEPRELFTDEEGAFFGKHFSANKLIAAKEKTENRAVCKPDMTRKCFWLDRKANEIFGDAVKALGFKTAQEWFLKAVDETIGQAEPDFEEKNYCNSDYMGREEISQ